MGRFSGNAPRTPGAISARTANGNGTGQDFSKVAGSVGFVLISNGGGVGETMDVKLQECDTLGGTYEDIPGAAFSQVGNAGLVEAIEVYMPNRKPFIRAAWTVSGGSFSSAIVSIEQPAMV